MFYRFFLILLLAISVPLWVITEISVRYSTDHIIRQATKFNLELLAQKQKLLEQETTNLANLSSHMLERQDLWTLVMSSESVAKEDFMMRNVIAYLTSAVSTQADIQSMYLYNDQDDFVLSDARYSKSDFPDPAVLHLNMTGNTEMLEPRTLTGNAPETSGPTVISYVRKFEGVYNQRVSYLVINLYADKFFDEVQLDQATPDMLIVGKGHQVVFDSASPASPPDSSLVERIADSPDNAFMLTDDSQRKYAFKAEMPDSDWTLVALYNYDELVEPAKLVRGIVFYTFGIVLLASLALAFVISAYLYKPLMQIIRKIRKIADLQSEGTGNEYKLIDYTINSLFTRNGELASKYNLVFPYFSRYFLDDLFGGRPLDALKFEQMLSLLGIQFPFRQYAIVLFDYENAPFDLQQKRHADKLLAADWDLMRHVLAKVDDHRAVAVVNTDQPMPWCYERMRALKQDLDRRHIDATMAMSGFVSEAEELPRAYREAEQLLESKFFIGKNELITEQNWSRPDGGPSAGRRLEKQVIDHVKSGHLGKAEEALDLLAADLLAEQAGIDYIRYIFYQMAADLVETLADLGFDVQEEFPAREALFEEMRQVQTLEDLKAYALRLMKRAAALMDRIKQGQHRRVVEQAQAFIQANYHRDISLDDVAGSVYLSAGYLSIIFKEQTGTTIYDSITSQRMQASVELLRSHPGLKVQEIAQRVGYNNVQSYLRHFKKHTAMTPNQYRRKLSGFPEESGELS